MMIRVVYVSSAVAPLSEGELNALLLQSQGNNHRAGITGMLLYRDGQFMQALEGDARVVRRLLQRIAADPRHEGMVQLLEEPIDERDFPTWAMGFENLGTRNIEGLPEFAEFRGCNLAGPEYGKEPTKVRRLLRLFRKSNEE